MAAPPVLRICWREREKRNDIVLRIRDAIIRYILAFFFPIYLKHIMKIYGIVFAHHVVYLQFRDEPTGKDLWKIIEKYMNDNNQPGMKLVNENGDNLFRKSSNYQIAYQIQDSTGNKIVVDAKSMQDCLSAGETNLYLIKYRQPFISLENLVIK